jgi:hypothetical protein
MRANRKRFAGDPFLSHKHINTQIFDSKKEGKCTLPHLYPPSFPCRTVLLGISPAHPAGPYGTVIRIRDAPPETGQVSSWIELSYPRTLRPTLPTFRSSAPAPGGGPSTVCECGYSGITPAAFPWVGDSSTIGLDLPRIIPATHSYCIYTRVPGSIKDPFRPGVLPGMALL